MSDVVKSVEQVETLKEHAVVKQLSCVEALRERRGDVVCFTPALLVTHGRMPADPAREFASRFSAPDDQQPFCVEVGPSAPAFFSGLGQTITAGKLIDWDRRLYAIATDRAKLCFDFLGGIGLHGDGFFASAVTYQLDIPDPTMRLQSAEIRVHIFGVLINNHITYLAPRLGHAPVVSTIKADAQLLQTSKFQINSTTTAALEMFRGEA